MSDDVEVRKREAYVTDLCRKLTDKEQQLLKRYRPKTAFQATFSDIGVIYQQALIRVPPEPIILHQGALCSWGLRN